MVNDKLILRSAILGIIFATLLSFILIFISEEYVYKIHKDDLKKFRLIRSVLAEYHKKCKSYPTTEEGLESIYKEKGCHLDKNSAEETFFSKNKKSTIVYFSDGNIYHLVIFLNTFGWHSESEF